MAEESGSTCSFDSFCPEQIEEESEVHGGMSSEGDEYAKNSKPIYPYVKNNKPQFLSFFFFLERSICGNY